MGSKPSKGGKNEKVPNDSAAAAGSAPEAGRVGQDGSSGRGDVAIGDGVTSSASGARSVDPSSGTGSPGRPPLAPKGSGSGLRAGGSPGTSILGVKEEGVGRGGADERSSGTTDRRLERGAGARPPPSPITVPSDAMVSAARSPVGRPSPSPITVPAEDDSRAKQVAPVMSAEEVERAAAEARDRAYREAEAEKERVAEEKRRIAEERDRIERERKALQEQEEARKAEAEQRERERQLERERDLRAESERRLEEERERKARAERLAEDRRRKREEAKRREEEETQKAVQAALRGSGEGGVGELEDELFGGAAPDHSKPVVREPARQPERQHKPVPPPDAKKEQVGGSTYKSPSKPLAFGKRAFDPDRFRKANAAVSAGQVSMPMPGASGRRLGSSVAQPPVFQGVTPSRYVAARGPNDIDAISPRTRAKAQAEAGMAEGFKVDPPASKPAPAQPSPPKFGQPSFTSTDPSKPESEVLSARSNPAPRVRGSGLMDDGDEDLMESILADL